MKKTYMKPAMAVEMFTMSQTVANLCGHNPDGNGTYTSGSNCAWVSSWGETYWLETNASCSNAVKAADGVDDYCYNAPVAGVSVFVS